MFCSILAACATCLCAAMSFAQTPTGSLTILLKYDHPGSSISQEFMQKEVGYLLGSGFAVRFGAVTDPFGSTSGRLVVFNMRGYCSMEHTASHVQRGLALGSTLVSEGSILPFGQVECDRIRASIQRLSQRNSEEADRQLGQAMGRVVVHELYHMLTGSSAHTKYGLTKQQLSSFELIASSATLPRESVSAMEAAAPPEQVHVHIDANEGGSTANVESGK